MKTLHDPVSLTRDLIRYPSVTPQDAGALAFLAGRLQSSGFQVHREVFSEPGTPDVENLYARIGSEGPHLVFAGHTDVVPPGDESAWTHRPFEAALADDHVYGRGAVDMKGAIACFVAAALDHLASNGGTPRGSISFLITGDEEGPGVNGTKKLLEWAAARGETFDHCVLGEPTNPERVGDMLKLGRRGSLSGTLTVSGKQGHVAYPHLADNPIRYLVRIMSEMMAETLDLGTEHFDASNLEFTSVDVGNRANNVIPGQASARFNIRFNDRHTLKSLKEWIETRAVQAARDDVTCKVDYAQGNSESFITQPGDFTSLVIDSIRDVVGRAPVLSTSGGTSDARFIKNYCPVIEFGLVGQTMHQIDERVPTDDLVTLTAVYRRIIERYFGQAES